MEFARPERNDIFRNSNSGSDCTCVQLLIQVYKMWRDGTGIKRAVPELDNTPLHSPFSRGHSTTRHIEYNMTHIPGIQPGSLLHLVPDMVSAAVLRKGERLYFKVHPPAVAQE